MLCTLLHINNLLKLAETAKLWRIEFTIVNRTQNGLIRVFVLCLYSHFNASWDNSSFELSTPCCVNKKENVRTNCNWVLFRLIKQRCFINHFADAPRILFATKFITEKVRMCRSIRLYCCYRKILVVIEAFTTYLFAPFGNKWSTDWYRINIYTYIYIFYLFIYLHPFWNYRIYWKSSTGQNSNRKKR